MKKKRSFSYPVRRISRSERLDQAANESWARNVPATVVVPTDADREATQRSLQEIAAEVRAKSVKPPGITPSNPNSQAKDQ